MRQRLPQIQVAAQRLAIGCLTLLLASLPIAADPLPSWTQGETKDQILGFVTAVTTLGGPDFVAPAERIAVFDNDGTLWSEQPFYAQLAFAIAEIARKEAETPGFAAEPPLSFAAKGDLPALFASGKKGIAAVFTASHAGMSEEAFEENARRWFESARHPVTGRPYTAMTYQPMRELIRHLQDNNFQVWIVSGGGQAFIRAFSEETYGVPRENVIGSTLKLALEGEGATAELQRQADLDFYDDGPGKVIGIEKHIGRRPIAAFGNSDGDIEMLSWTMAGTGPRLAALLHHDDAQRETAYDRESAFGRLDQGFARAAAEGWLLISMKDDWSEVFGD